ncbi:MAG: hypothetical protein GXX96_35645 [Planctomycetaceae bacterium]|nr:hypothetical protein [Planctomycetaceae bacterium]
MPQYLVFMQSDEFGRETFPRDSLDDALDTIRNLVAQAESLNDGIEREIGIVVNADQDDEA